jgi:hypothetical protein
MLLILLCRQDYSGDNDLSMRLKLLFEELAAPLPIAHDILLVF